MTFPKNLKGKFGVANITQEPLHKRQDSPQKFGSKVLLTQPGINVFALEIAKTGGQNYFVDGEVEGLKALAFAQQHGMRVGIIDCVGTFDVEYAENCGIDLDETYVYFPATIYEFVQNARFLIANCDLIIVDSPGYFVDKRNVSESEYQQNIVSLHQVYQSVIGTKCSILATNSGLANTKRAS